MTLLMIKLMLNLQGKSSEQQLRSSHRIWREISFVIVKLELNRPLFKLKKPFWISFRYSVCCPSHDALLLNPVCIFLFEHINIDTLGLENSISIFELQIALSNLVFLFTPGEKC